MPESLLGLGEPEGHRKGPEVRLCEGLDWDRGGMALVPIPARPFSSTGRFPRAAVSYTMSKVFSLLNPLGQALLW